MGVGMGVGMGMGRSKCVVVLEYTGPCVGVSVQVSPCLSVCMSVCLCSNGCLSIVRLYACLPPWMCDWATLKLYTITLQCTCQRN